MRVCALSQPDIVLVSMCPARNTVPLKAHFTSKNFRLVLERSFAILIKYRVPFPQFQVAR